MYFLSKISAKDDGCWVWIGSISDKGYGIYHHKGKRRPAHRASYDMFVGFIEKNTVIDHTCRNRSCVNPDHLREVSSNINSLENTNSHIAKFARKTHCINGHEFTEENTVVKSVGVYGGLHRGCRICRKNSDKERYLKRKTANV